MEVDSRQSHRPFYGSLGKSPHAPALTIVDSRSLCGEQPNTTRLPPRGRSCFPISMLGSCIPFQERPSVQPDVAGAYGTICWVISPMDQRLGSLRIPVGRWIKVEF